MTSNVTGNDLIKVGIVDDQISATNAFFIMVNAMPGIKAVFLAYSGQELLNLLKTMAELPDILLMDVEMPGMNGIETTKAVADLYPTIKILAFTVNYDDGVILQMIGAGACAYLTKQLFPDQLEEAIREVYQKGKYKADLYHLYSPELREYSKNIKDLVFTDNEKQFLKLLCKGYQNNHIAREMGITIHGVAYLKHSLAEKLNTKSSAVMALEALRMGIVTRYDQNKRQPKTL